jgi:ribosomal protein S18 acetylase RimI-like enzyme
MRARHLRGPRWYLQFLAVDPTQQGKGYGGMLLRHILNRLDRERVACCLDTEKAKNVSFYEHYGFRVMESSKIPGSDCDCWLMARGPKS